jgi:hypothetical protein
MAVCQPSTSLYHYELERYSAPQANANPEKEAAAFLDRQRLAGLTQKEAENSHDSVLKSFREIRNGSTSKGKTTVSCGDWGSEVRTFIPSDVGGFPVLERFDGKATFQRIAGMHDHIMAANKRDFFGSAADLLVLAGYLPTSAKLKDRKLGTPYSETWVFESDGRRPEQFTMQWDSSEKGKLLRGEMGYLVDEELMPHSVYEVTAWRKIGTRLYSADLTIYRFGGKNWFGASDHFILKAITDARAPELTSGLERGGIILDNRLGKLVTINYPYLGVLPSLDELRGMKAKGDLVAKATSAPALTLLGALGCLLIGFILSWSRRKRVAGRRYLR